MKTYVHVRYLAQFFLAWEMFHTKFVDQNRTRFLLSNVLPKIGPLMR